MAVISVLLIFSAFPTAVAESETELRSMSVTKTANPDGTEHYIVTGQFVWPDGTAIVGATAEIWNEMGEELLGSDVTDENGFFHIEYDYLPLESPRRFHIKLVILGVTIFEFIWDAEKYETDIGKVEVPEFPTIALPIVAVSGIIFLMFRRKHKS
jgi:hypothetical protein